MTTELRVPGADDVDEWFRVVDSAFGGILTGHAEGLQKWRKLLEPGRAVTAWDAGEMVGTAGAHTFRMTVPGGGCVPTAGVTMVSVKPTHRRRGVLTSMMRRQLDDVHEWGEPLAVLTASEAAIYGRFGYAVATGQLTADVDTVRAPLSVPAASDAVRLRLVPAGDPAVFRACEDLYARQVPRRPGMLRRMPGWEDMPLHDPARDRHGASPLQCVLAELDGELRGYARYAVRPDADAAGAKGEVLLRELEALDPAAHGALVRYLFGIDLTCTLSTHNRPVDDPWLQMVSDLRRCRIGIRDGLHVRLVDVGAALAARTYQAPVDVVLEVEDGFCPWNAGRWRLAGDAKGAVCEPTRDAPDLALSVRELGAGYLGGPTLTALAGAGRVREVRAGALAQASVAFRSDVAPWLPHGF
ncbi:MAG TPA: GNAT family N-acetyltransferase [Streptomyces sp.]|nr:GNAT family N-acetyltransferase [Streptomyces sp.]